MAKLADLKTKANTLSVDDFCRDWKMNKRKDSLIILKLMQKWAREKPVMWESSLIGFGKKFMRVRLPEEKWNGLNLAFLREKRIFQFMFFWMINSYSIIEKIGKTQNRSWMFVY